MNKSFCILEQGRELNEPRTVHKKELFTTEFSDFYRLNWFHENDLNAYICATGLTWSEGRSFLYEKVPKQYDYYIFTDDDIDFSAAPGVNIALKIKQLLEEYRPIAGTFYAPRQWGFANTIIPHEEYVKRRVFPVAGYDMMTQIFAASFAEVMFPIIYHGAHRTLWYPQWVCSQTFPRKHLAFADVWARNARGGSHSKKKPPQHYESTEVLYLFNRDVKGNLPVVKTKQQILERNAVAFQLDVDTTPIEFCLEDLARVYNTNNSDFRYRASLADSRYMHRKPWNHFWFKFTRKLTGAYRYG